MLADVLPHLRCPLCAAGTDLDGGAVRCAAGHLFDVAKQGYTSLFTGGRHPQGDTAEMVAARAEFLGAGHYAPIAAAIAAAVTDLCGAVRGPVLEVGAGTAWYLASIVDGQPDAVGIALDASRYALRRAARAHPRIGAVGCDVWQGIPVRDGAVPLALTVFAPRNGPELRRVLTPDGVLLVVAPTAAHLTELVTALRLIEVDADKQDRIDRQLAPGLRPAGSTACEFALSLSHREVSAVVGMGPSAWHVAGPALADRIAALPDPVPVTASVLVSAYGPA